MCHVYEIMHDFLTVMVVCV